MGYSVLVAHLTGEQEKGLCTARAVFSVISVA